MYTYLCGTCGKTFEAVHKERRYCSRACYAPHAGPKQRKFTPEQEQAICEEYTQPLPDGTYFGANLLGRKYGVGPQTVYFVLRKHCVPTRDAKTSHSGGKACRPQTRIPPAGEMPPLCRCGCNERTYWIRKKNHWAQYVKGHYTQRGTQNHSWASDPSVLTPDGFAKLLCPVCSKIFLCPAKKRTMYCSESCAGVAKRSPHYEGRERWYGWHSVRKHIRERDNWTCQDCGYEGKRTKRRMHVHHIDHNPMNNGDDNLVLLCHRCHLTRHGLTPPSDWPD